MEKLIRRHRTSKKLSCNPGIYFQIQMHTDKQHTLGQSMHRSQRTYGNGCLLQMGKMKIAKLFM